MPVTDPPRKEKWSPRPLHLQLLFAVLAFLLMIFSSYFYVHTMLRDYLQKGAEQMLTQTRLRIASDLQEPKTLMIAVSSDIRDIITRGGGLDDVRRYVDGLSRKLRNKADGFPFDGIQGYFEALGGVYLPALGWTPPDDYDPTVRPWYKAAVDAEGGIVPSPMYLSLRSGRYQISYSCRIFDDEDNPLGVIALNVPLSNIADFVANMRLTEGGYGFLANERFFLVTHPDENLINRPMSEASPGFRKLAELMDRETGVLRLEYKNYREIDSIFYCQRIENGWYLGLITPEDEYYHSLTTLTVFLGVLGAVMIAALCAILIRIDVSRRKLDAAYREQGLQLTHMKKLREAEELTQLIFEAIPLCANAWNRDLKSIYANEASARMFGLPGKPESFYVFFDVSPEYQPDGRLSMEKGFELVRRAFEGEYIRTDWLHRKLDGELIPCEVIMVRIKYKDDYAVVGYAYDKREIVAANEAARRAVEEKNMFANLANILNGLDTMIVVTDPKTNGILFINDKMKRHFGIEGDGIGRICYKVFQKDLDERCDFCPCFRLDEEPGRIIVWEEHSTLTNRIYVNTHRYIPWPNGETVHLQHSVDVTELVAAKEAAEQSNRSKSVFLASMSHEIRTPMNAILGIAEIQLFDETISPGAEEAFRQIYESGYLLINILNDILDFSKIDAGKMEITPVNYDILSLINDTVQLNHLRYESRPVEFKLQLDENTPLDLFGDELRVKQILNNLLSNAFKYNTENGKVRLSISAEPGPERNGEDSEVTLVFQVSDTGQGLTQEQIDKIFEEYTRFNIGINRATVGTGLGMSITKRLVDMMGGKIFVESEVGQGSVFTVRLPQKRTSSAVCGAELSGQLQNFRYQSTSIMKKAQILREYMPYGSVLVVDDIESNLFVAKGMLQLYGLQVETASSGLQAVEKIRNGAVYNIVFMDHMMPEMNGIEAVKILRDLGYEHHIVALTANAIIGQADMFLANGFDGFISKPIDSRELNAVLNSMIRDKQPPEVVEEARREQREKGRKDTAVHGQRTSQGSELKKFFTSDAEKAVNVLEGMSSRLDAPGDDDLESYIIAVHGMKSALANIGEKEMSGLALKLERAGKDRDFALMSDKTPAFTGALRALIERFRPKEESGGLEISGEDAAYLREKLLAVKEACAAFEKDAAKTALNELKQKTWPRHVVEVLDEISMHLLHSAFKKAVAIVEKAME